MSQEKFQFTWSIENIHMCLQENGESISSPSFTVKTFLNSVWCLELYPRGCNEKYENYLSCFLSRIRDDGPEDIEIYFKFIVNSVSSETVRYRFKKEDSYGYYNYFKGSQKSSKDNICVVECHMYILLDRDTKSYTEMLELMLLPPFWEPELLRPETRKELFSSAEQEIEGLQRNIWLFPKHCFARTRASVERVSVTCPIKNIVCLNETENLHLPLSSCSQTPTFFITLNKILNADVAHLEVKVYFIEKLLTDVLLHCEMQMVHPQEKTHCTVENWHLFENSKLHEVWKFEDSFHWIELIKKENSKLKLKFSISDGSHFSNIEHVGNVGHFTTNISDRADQNILSDGIFHLYNEKRFCDVKLQTSEETFETHKTVLCGISPVFAAMFESGMKESDTNNVFIDDLDSDTVGQMLTFMYTGKVEQLEFDKAINLFSAADKYEIVPLKKVCRTFLKKNLSVENICSVLSLADAHNDIELKESAIYFISVFKNVLFSSKQWKIFVDSNAKIVSEILQEVCSKYL